MKSLAIKQRLGFLYGRAAITLMMPVLLFGCDGSFFKQDTHKKDTHTPTTQVEIPKTAPLQAGMSVSRAQALADDSKKTTDSLSTSKNIALTPTDKAVNSTTSPKKVATANVVSIVTTKVKAGTPEATLKKALDTVYSGNAKEAAQYYDIKDVKSFALELQAAQKSFQDTIESVTFKPTEFNQTKTKARINCDVKIKGQMIPQGRSFVLTKVDGQWKISG